MNIQSGIEYNKTLIEKYFNELWNKGKLELLDEIISPDYINHSPSKPNPIPGPKGLLPIIEEMLIAFPDLNYKILDLVITENCAVARLNVTGTHKNSIWGINATNKTFSFNQVNIEYIRDGKISEHWRISDELSWMKQLEVLK